MPHIPLSPVSPEQYHALDGARTFDSYELQPGLEVVAQEDREKSDLDPVLILNSPDSYIDHGRWEEAPQVIDTAPPQAMGDAALEPNGRVQASSPVRQDRDAAVAEKGSIGEDEEEKKTNPKRWCWLSKKMLLLVSVLVLLLIGAAIGGAVGGTQANKKKPTPEQINEQSAATQTGSSPSRSESFASGTTSSSSSAPTEHVRFQLQTYENYNYEGRSQLFTEPGLFKPAWPILSYIWSPAKSGDYLDESLLRCSVAFCANATENGWWGSSAKKQPGSQSSKHDANYLHIACDKLNVTPGCDGLDSESSSISASSMPVMETPGSPTPTEAANPQSTGANMGT